MGKKEREKEWERKISSGTVFFLLYLYSLEVAAAAAANKRILSLSFS